MENAINTERLEPLIFRIRGHRVVLDADLEYQRFELFIRKSLLHAASLPGSTI